MRATAAANPDVMKLETDRHVDARQADPRDQDDRRTRATCPTARAPRSCSRRSTTRASGSRPRWAAVCRSGSRRTRTTRRSASSSRRASSGSCRSRTRTATTSRSPAASAPRRSRATTASAPPTTTASGARRSATTTPTASTATTRTASTRTATTRPSAASTRRARRNSFSSGTYRGPYPLSEPDNLAVDRLQRRVKFYGNINYHTDGQLLLTPVSYTTDYYPPDSTIFEAMTGTDGDERRVPVPAAALVGPLRVQRRHDRQRVPELRHHRLDAGDGHLRHGGRARRTASASRRRTTRRR